jgi:integrase
MTRSAGIFARAVRGLDAPAKLGTSVNLLTRAPKPQRPKLAASRDRRFREATPDYRTLLTGVAHDALDPFMSACLDRWTDRWSLLSLREVDTDEILNYFHELVQRGHTREELQRERSLLQTFFRWASRCGWADRNPVEAIRHLPQLPNGRPVAWTGVEQRRLLRATQLSTRLYRTSNHRRDKMQGPGSVPRYFTFSPPTYLYPLTLVALRTGLRLGNLLNLEWRHLDLKTGRILIPGSEVRTGRNLSIPLSVDVLGLLHQLCRQALALPKVPRRVFEAAGLPLRRGAPDARKVLYDFRQARKRAGILAGDFHSLRLSFVRNCAQAGVPIDAARRIADWDDEDQLEEIFREHSPCKPSARTGTVVSRR